MCIRDRTNTVPAADQAGLLDRLLNDQSIAQVQLYFRYYLGRAMSQTGLGDRYVDNLGPWERMMAVSYTHLPTPRRMTWISFEWGKESRTRCFLTKPESWWRASSARFAARRSTRDLHGSRATVSPRLHRH